MNHIINIVTLEIMGSRENALKKEKGRDKSQHKSGKFQRTDLEVAKDACSKKASGLLK